MSCFNKSDITVIYIAGYGRSGSTLLDIILSNVDGVRSLGEGANFFELCSSPEYSFALSNGFWGQVKEKVSLCLRGDEVEKFANANQKQRKIERFRSGWRLFLPLWKDVFSSYRVVVDCLFHSIYDLSEETKIFVDSSKTAWLSSWRPYCLHKAGYRVKMIHLVRDGRSVIGSFLKGDNVKMLKGLDDVSFSVPVTRSIFGWVFANISAFINGKSIPGDCSYLLRYEDLVNNTQQELIGLGSFLGIDLKPVAFRLAENLPLNVKDAGLSGNRIIKEDSITMTTGLVKPPVLDSMYLLYYWLVAGWLHKMIYSKVRK